jgi:hypothetical protein
VAILPLSPAPCCAVRSLNLLLHNYCSHCYTVTFLIPLWTTMFRMLMHRLPYKSLVFAVILTTVWLGSDYRKKRENVIIRSSGKDLFSSPRAGVEVKYSLIIHIFCWDFTTVGNTELGFYFLCGYYFLGSRRGSMWPQGYTSCCVVS